MAEDRPDIDRVRREMRERDEHRKPDDGPPPGEEADRTQLDDPVREELRRRGTRGDD